MNDLRIVNLATYTTPEIVEQQNQDWIAYGQDNNYFQYLIDRYNGSPTNSACMNAISEMIFGKGLDATDSNRRPEQYAKMLSLFDKDCVRKLCYDLKLMGQCAIQIIYSKDRKTIAQIEHMPVETLRAEKCNDEGDIPAYFYYQDWAKYKRGDELLRIPAFGMSKENIEILYVKPYRAGFKYYSSPDYAGGLQYADLEEEISNYHLNNILNGLAPSMLINFNNGSPNSEERELIEKKIYQKFSGSSNAGKFILAFNDDPATAASIEPIQLSDAHNQYQFLSDESSKKILVSHRVVSPMLIGIKDNTGLGNNADEIKTASLLMDNTVIRPFQRLLIDAFDKILGYNEITLNLYFITLQPLEFTEIEKIDDEEVKEEETGVKLKKIDGQEVYKTKEEAEEKAIEKGCKGSHQHKDEDGNTWYMPCEDHKEIQNLSNEDGDILLNNLIGGPMSDEWEEVTSRTHSDKNESIEEWATKCIEVKKTGLQKLQDYIVAKPNGFSYLDKGYYKVRYRYHEDIPSENSRDFCIRMMARSSDGIVYRLEDIDKASREGVNDSFGHLGMPYDLFKYKGGVYCGHTWKEVLYRLKDKTKKSKNLKDYNEVDSIPKSYRPNPRGTRDSEIPPFDMPNHGHYPGVK